MADKTDQASLGRANDLLLAGESAAAGLMFARLLAEHPDHPDVLHGLGVLAWQGGRIAEARAYLQKAVAGSQHPALYLSLLGEVERQGGDLAAAESCLVTALGLAPDLAEAHCNLGVVRLVQEQYIKAAGNFLEAIRIKPEMALAHYNLGIAFKEINRLDDAIECYRTAITLKADFVEAHVNLAIALLLAGQLEQGFAEYEWRRRPPFMPLVTHAQPEWDGQVDPEGVLLLRTEQGVGDTLQFARYLPFIAAAGMKVIVECRPELERLLRSVDGVSATCRPGEPTPAHTAQLPLASLPRLFATRIESIPANVPYLHPHQEEVSLWQERLLAEGETIKVGLCWAGNPNNSEDHRRSCALALFSGLGGIDRLSLISLQKDRLSAADQSTAEQLGLVDYARYLHDFADTAALIANLDLVIAVDTAVLHLAAALGVPTWGLLRFSPHWPWLLGRDDSPWYPSLRLFRQSRPGDWLAVADQVVALLTGAMDDARDGGTT